MARGAMRAERSLLGMAVLLAAASHAAAQVSIASITNAGSAGGGVRLVIQGTGFSTDRYTGGNVVSVGPYPCNVINHLTSDKLITCETTPGNYGTYTVTVVVDGTYSASSCCFTYDRTLTPTLKAVYPSAGPPATSVKILGGDPGPWYTLDKSCADASSTADCVGEITFGDYLCLTNPYNVDSVFATGARRYTDSGLYQLSCTLPDATVTPAPGLGVARSVNVSVHFGAAMRSGSPLVERSAYIADSTGNKPYLFQLYPEVTSVSPSDGSVAGGTLITITGRGFPDSSAPLLKNTISVTVAGQPCTVVSSTYTTVLCSTPAQGSQAQPSVTLSNGTVVYPGMRGIQFEFFNYSYSGTADLPRLGSAITVEGSSGNRSTLQGTWETPLPLYSLAQHCTRSMAFFRPPVDGDYTFWLAGDDSLQLRGTWTMANGTVATGQLLASIGTATLPYAWSPSAASGRIALTAGQAFLLELAHCNGGGVSLAQVAVTVPSSTPKFFSTPDTQEIRINTQRSQLVQTVKVLTGTPNRTGYTLTLSSSSQPSLLSNPAVGLQLTVTGGTTSPTTFNFSVASTEDQVTSAVACALGNCNSNRVHTTKSMSATSVTFQIGVNSLALPTFTLASPTLVILPTGSLSTSSSSSCTLGSNNTASTLASAASPVAAPLLASVTSAVTVTLAAASTSLPVATSAAGPSGSITLSLVGGGDGSTVDVPLSANSTVVANAVQQLVGVRPDQVLVQGPLVPDGSFLATRWRITFPFWMGNNVPTLAAVATPGVALSPSGASVTAVVTARASANITGTIRVGYGGLCEYATIDPARHSGTDIKALIQGLPGIPAVPLTVTKTGGADTGYTITVVFDPATSPGLLPLLVVQDATGLNGTQLSVAVTKVRNGSTDLFFVIPTEMTQVPTTVSNTIGVSVNGVPAACTDPASCAFAYNAAKTPSMTSVSPSPINFAGAATVTLTIAGSFATATASNTQVTVGSAVCNSPTVTASQITCTLNNTVLAGSRKVNVNVAPLGFASGAPSVIVQVLSITAVSPTTLSTSGWTLVTIASAGIDTDCANNVVTIGGVASGIVSCSPGVLTAAFPGGTASASASVVLSVVDPSSGATRDTNTWTSTVTIASPGSSIASLTGSPSSGAGGPVSATLAAGMDASLVTSTFLIPASALLTGTPTFSALSDAFKNKYICTNTTATSATAITCNSGALPNNRYYLALVYTPASGSPVTLVHTATTITTSITITGISPAAGSIGGGTPLVITGTGFSTTLDANVVLITVPVSSTFLNGVVLCDVTAATSTQITCATRTSAATDATGYDQMARLVTPRATPPAAVQVVLCSTNLTDASKLACWSEARTPRANCTASGSCNYAYTTAATPYLVAVSPVSSRGGLPISVSGTNLDAIATVNFLQGTTVRGTCTNVVAASSQVTCTLPSLAAGAYTVQLLKANGEKSVVEPNGGSAAFLSQPYVTGITANFGSVAGGNPVTITSNATVDGATTGFNTATPANNVVTIGGLPCAVDTATLTATSLTCTPSNAYGRVFAEYWPVGQTGGFPDVASLSMTPPALTRFESTAKISWGTSSPDKGALIPVDYFAARFTFYLAIAQTGSYTFYLGGDDLVMLYINDRLIGQYTWGMSSAFNTTLTAGVSKVVVVFKETAGSASVSLMWNNATGNGQQDLPWSQVTAIAPGTLVPIRVSVNGVPSIHSCPATAVDASGAGVPTPGEQSSIPAAAGGTCGYVYSSYRTPALTTVVPAVSGGNLTLTGGLLGGLSASAYSASIGGVAASVVSVGGTAALPAVTLAVPSLPAGVWPVRLLVTGYGFTRNPFDYGMSISTSVSVSTATAGGVTFSSGSVWGGATITLTGSGFVPTNPDLANGKSMTVLYNRGDDANADSWTATVLSASTSSLQLRVGRWFSDAVPVANVSTSTVYFQVRVFTTGTDGSDSSTFSTYSLAYSRSTAATPQLSSVSPATLSSASAGGNLTISWFMTGGPTVSSIAAGRPSLATVQLVSGSSTFDCAPPTVTVASTTYSSGRGYSETLTCTLPAYLPAATYTVALTHPYVGVGWSSNALTVPLTITAISPSRGSAGGGLAVTVSGTGFSTTASDNTVTLGGIPCAVTAATQTSLTCTTGPNAAVGTSIVNAALAAAALPGVNTSSFPSVIFAYDPAVTDAMTSMNTTRGSTAGGTPLLISGTFRGVASEYTIRLGDAGAACAITSFTATAIACTTSAPPSPKPLNPLPIYITRAGSGIATGSLTFQYVDLWSRRSTWGGNLPPIEGDSVYIPANSTVMLDVSPPRLYLLVVEGNLVFDTDAGADIWLQANYILIKGGNMSAGTPETPYAGNARITLWGAPNDVELPLYGKKVIAVRDGWVILHGKHKQPTWTQLNATANVGDTTITVNGVVNWVAGDRIVLSSSSVYATDVDEVTIATVTPNTAAKTTTLTLTSSLKYTHLGVLLSNFPGDDRGHVLDMRAEVAVLSRNVVVEGDPTSAQYQMGATVLISTPSNRPRAGILFEQAEFRQMGQAFGLGRYAIHWHMHGRLGYKQYIRGCAVHHSYNRATTIHGTHEAILEHNVAYDIMGHTYFLEDSIETGNIFDGNCVILTKPSLAMLNTDFNAASYWITNPNNTYRNNVAAGSSNGYGFWYQLLPFADGPSATNTVCPRFTPLGEFTNNRAHSNMFYGLRIHPEFYPRVNPCNNGGGFGSLTDRSTFVQVPAVFNGFISYKNGMKGAIATQVGLVRFNNFTMADNGAGPLQHIVNGKDNGANYELTWVVDDRSRINTDITNMAGLQNALLIGRTVEGAVGTAGVWPNPGRKITGVIMHSPAEFHSRHTALASLVNVTFMNYTGGQFHALEFCGKCKSFQGGATAHTANIRFWNPNNAPVSLSQWSWGHQGIFNDTDGTLLTNSIPAALRPTTWSIGPGATWHSAVNNDMFRPEECVYVRNALPTSNNGALCSPALNFRRVMMNRHAPPALAFRNIYLTDMQTNRSSYVYFQHYNEDGYQFTVPTTRNYLTHWDMDFRVDPSDFTYHKMDPLSASAGYVHLSQRYVQRKDSFTVNGRSTTAMNLTAPALPTTNASGTAYPANGASFYNKTFSVDSRVYGNTTYNSTQFTLYMAGTMSLAELAVRAMDCPVGGTCNNDPDVVIDVRVGTLLWSEAATWSSRPGGAPVAGDNVTIPFGWNLVIDVDTPVLYDLVIQGNVTFSTSASATLRATFIRVWNTGYLWAGQRNAPHPTLASIVLYGTRQTTEIPISNDLNLGSKVLAAFGGGKIDLFGQPVARRWTKLAATASAASATLVVDGVALGWSVGQQVLVTSSSWNPWQAEIRTITALTPNTASSTTTLTLDSPLANDHWSKVKAYPGAKSAVDMRVEVGLLSSNIQITAADGPATYTRGTGELFGARIIVHGNSTGRFSNIAVTYGGQAGLLRPAVLFQGLRSVNTVSPLDALPNGGGSASDPSPYPAADASGAIPNPSFLVSSALVRNMDSGVVIRGDNKTQDVSQPTRIEGNVVYESYDISTIDIQTRGNTIRNNLALGTIKEMVGKSTQDLQMPATFMLAFGDNTVEGNVAAGSERLGYMLYGPPCSRMELFRNNAAHSSVTSMWLQSSTDSSATGCTAVYNFTSYMSWDFGIITTKGINTDVQLVDFNVLDMKHAGILILRIGGMYDPAEVNVTGGVIAGATGPEVCALCNSRIVGLESVTSGPDGNSNVAYQGDPGCAPKVTRKSYNQASPFTPARGLVSTAYAIAFTPGPDKKPWDGLKGYPMIQGISRHWNVTFADFQGPSCSAGTYALANHHLDTDAFHPHNFWGTNLVNVSNDGLALFTGPDPGWRDEAHCGLATFTRPDGSILDLNCGGPRHAMFRDMDGTMLQTGGVPAALTGNLETLSTGRSFPYDQGTPLAHGPCVYSPTLKGYRCLANQTTFTTPPMNLALKPNPIPASGIFGDPQMFVFESRDPDTEDRNFSPIFVNVSGSVDLIVTPFDHGWCFAYSCRKRISNFWTYVPSGQTVNLTFTGSPPKNSRLWFPYADPSAEIIVAISFQGVPLRKFVWTEEFGRFPAPSNAPPTIGDGQGHGAFYWDQLASIMWVKVKGGKNLEIRTDNAVQVTNTLALDVNAFYDNQATFLAGIAFVLGITDMARIKVVNVVAGSAVVKYMLYDTPAASMPPTPNLTPDTSANIDAADAAYLNTLTPAQRDAYKASVLAENAAMAASFAGGNAASPAAPPAAASPPGAASELSTMLTNLANGVKSGTLQKQTGMQVLSFAVDSSGINALSAADLAALTATINQINADCTLNGRGCPPPGSPVANQDSPSGSSSNNMGIIIGASVGGGLVLIAALAGAAVMIKRKNASRHLQSPPEGAKRRKSDAASDADADDTPVESLATTPGPKKSFALGMSNRVSPAPSATGSTRPDISPRISAAGAVVGATASALVAAEDGSAPPSPARSPLGRPGSSTGAVPVRPSSASGAAPRSPSASGATLDPTPGAGAAMTAGAVPSGPKILNPRPDSGSAARASPKPEDPAEAMRFGLPGAPAGASMNHRTYMQLAGGNGDGGGMVASSTGPTNVNAMPPPPLPPAPVAAGSPRKGAALEPLAGGQAAPGPSASGADGSLPVPSPRPSASSVPQKPYNRLPALGAQKATLAPLAPLGDPK